MGKFTGLRGQYEYIHPASLLEGFVHIAGGQTFFTVRGPCGEGHTMSADEARRLRDWLNANLPTNDDPNWRLTWMP